MSLTNSQASSLWTRRRGTIPANGAVIVDSLPIGQLLGYWADIKMRSGSTAQSLKLDASIVDGDSKDQVYSRRGDSLSIEVRTDVIAGNFELTLNNQTASVIEYSVIRTTT